EPLNTCPAVSVVWNWSTLQVGGPLTNSVPEVWTVTSLVYHPFAPAVPAVTDKATAVGAVASYLKLKAMSPLEGVEVQLAIPEVLSVPLKLTVTALVYQLL